MYINIMLTIIAIGYWVSFYNRLTTGKQIMEESEANNEYAKKLNDEVLELHKKMLKELKKISGSEGY